MSEQNGTGAPSQRGATVWLTGLPSAGKSTIAHDCEARLLEHLTTQGLCGRPTPLVVGKEAE